MSASSRIVLFDGECAYCNGWVRWIAQRDRSKVFRFVALATPEGMALRSQHRVAADIDSIVLIEDGRAWLRSDAAWRIFRALPGWGITAFLLRLIPRPLRDTGYALIASNRHRLGGKALPPL